MSADAPGELLHAVTDAFVNGRLDVAARPDACAPARGWRSLPEVAVEAVAARAIVAFGCFRVVA
jgi:hypothetical protein